MMSVCVRDMNMYMSLTRESDDPNERNGYGSGCPGTNQITRCVGIS